MPDFGKLLNRLVLARKHIQFYPPNSPIVNDALAALEKDFESVFAPSAGNNSPPTTFRLEVGREGFIVEGAPVATENEVVKRFANDLFRLGLKQLIFQAGVSVEDFRCFLTLLSRPADKIKAEGGIETAIKAASLSHIHVERPETLEMVTLDESNPGLDLTEQLRQRASRQDAGATMVRDGTDASDLAGFFAELASDDEELQQKLADALANPEQLAQTFNIAHKSGQEPNAEGEGLSEESMRKILKSISRNIASLPPDKRRLFAKNVADAVMASNSETRDVLLHDTLAQGIGEGGIEEEVVSFLSKEDAAGVLASHATLHKGTADTISNYMAQFATDTGAQTSLSEMVASKLDDQDVQRIQDVAQLLKREDLEKPKEQPKVSRGDQQKRNQLSKEREELVQELAISEESIGGLRLRMMEDCGDASYVYAGVVVLALHEEEGVPLLTDSLGGLLERSLAVSLRSGQYGDVSRLLAAMSEECGDEAPKGLEGLEEGEAADSSAGRKAFCERIKEKTCTHGDLKDFIVVFQGLQPQTEAYEDLLGCVHWLGAPAVHALVEEYLGEEDPSVQSTYVEFFREIGERCTGILQDRVNKVPTGGGSMSSHRGTLCKTIGLIGELGAPSGYDILEPLINYGDPKVRQATLTALSKIPHDRVEAALIKAIMDPDPDVGTHAVRIVDQLKVRSALPALTRFLRAHRKDFHKESARCMAIARAIGGMGGTDELAAFKDLMPGGIAGWLGVKDPVTEEFRSAVARIERRIEVKRA